MAYKCACALVRVSASVRICNTHACRCVFASVRVCAYECGYACTCADTGTCACERACACAYACAYAWASACAYSCACASPFACVECAPAYAPPWKRRGRKSARRRPSRHCASPPALSALGRAASGVGGVTLTCKSLANAS
eukprot:2742785-Pleurochrysis_carterae.AAC.1